MLQNLKHKYIGDKDFYAKVLAVAVPIMIQNGFTNLVNMLDNIMVGRVGTEEASGVSIVNTLLFVFLLCIFGGSAGAGIFTAQYFGQGNMEGIRHTMRYKLYFGILLTAIAILLFLFKGDFLIQAYLKGDPDAGDPALALAYGHQYMLVMLIGLPALMISMSYASTLRECGETALPMRTGIIAVLINLGLNYLLIYGKFGCPKLGVVGAAVATVISRYSEMTIIIVRTHMRRSDFPFAVGLYKSLRVPKEMLFKYFLKSAPLLLNEGMWSGGVAMLNLCYSTRGLSVVMGMNIASTVNNVFNVAFVAMGDAIAIIVGQMLGAEEFEKAKDTDNKLIVFTMFCALVTGGLMLLVSPFFPRIYETTELAMATATKIMIVMAIFMPQQSFMHASYFTLRSGGKIIITLLFDSVFMWCVSVSLAWVLSHYTDMSAIRILVCVYLADFIKCVIGYILVKKNIWIQNIVN